MDAAGMELYKLTTCSNKEVPLALLIASDLKQHMMFYAMNKCRNDNP
jgi:hypothetical protein